MDQSIWDSTHSYQLTKKIDYAQVHVYNMNIIESADYAGCSKFAICPFH